MLKTINIHYGVNDLITRIHFHDTASCSRRERTIHKQECIELSLNVLLALTSEPTHTPAYQHMHPHISLSLLHISIWALLCPAHEFDSSWKKVVQMKNRTYTLITFTWWWKSRRSRQDIPIKRYFFFSLFPPQTDPGFGMPPNRHFQRFKLSACDGQTPNLYSDLFSHCVHNGPKVGGNEKLLSKSKFHTSITVMNESVQKIQKVS